jgi:DNA-binding MarR family transcriptional regulator
VSRTISIFAKIIRKLEEDKIIGTYKHRFCRKKYIFFSPFGESLLASEKNPTSISKKTIIHDLKVTEICLNLKNIKWVDQVLLEHQLHNKRNFKTTFKIIPDALLKIDTSKSKYNLAFELELSQKDRPRIIEKAKEYMISTKYDYIIYFFASKSTLEKYRKEIYDNLPNDRADRFMFFYDENITVKKTNLSTVSGIFRNKDISMEEIFSKFNRS